MFCDALIVAVVAAMVCAPAVCAPVNTKLLLALEIVIPGKMLIVVVPVVNAER